jgi:hypothetical protein
MRYGNRYSIVRKFRMPVGGPWDASVILITNVDWVVAAGIDISDPKPLSLMLGLRLVCRHSLSCPVRLGRTERE